MEIPSEKTSCAAGTPVAQSGNRCHPANGVGNRVTPAAISRVSSYSGVHSSSGEAELRGYASPSRSLVTRCQLLATEAPLFSHMICLLSNCTLRAIRR